MKAEVAIQEAQNAVSVLDPKLDRIGFAAFDQSYSTVLAPTHDFRRVKPALRQVWNIVTNPEPRGSNLFRAIGEMEDAFHAHSADRIQVGLVLTDGGDSSGDAAEAAGFRSQLFMQTRPGKRHIEVIAIGRDQSVDYGALGRYAKVGNLSLLDGPDSLGAVVRRSLFRVVAKVTGAAEISTENVTLKMLAATLAVERIGIDLMFLFDCSSSMNRFEVTLPEATTR
ncbi:VWA domain-containing protein [Tuwongella immobilis]|nr:vWA domain-containing protein [Tuwongella immobilis]